MLHLNFSLESKAPHPCPLVQFGNKNIEAKPQTYTIARFDINTFILLCFNLDQPVNQVVLKRKG